MAREKLTTEDFVNVVVIENLLDALDIACHSTYDKELILPLQRAARDVTKLLPEDFDWRVYRMSDDGSDAAKSLYRILPPKKNFVTGPSILPSYNDPAAEMRGNGRITFKEVQPWPEKSPASGTTWNC